MTVAGTSVEDATVTSLTLHELAHVNYLAYAVGTPLAVPDLQAHRSRWTGGSGGDGGGGGGRNGGAVNAAGESFTWRYNKKLLAASFVDGAG